MKDKVYVKILRKESDGVTCYFPGAGKAKTSWYEFNKIYEIDPNDKFIAYEKPEWIEKHRKANEYFNQAMAYLMMNNGAARNDPSKFLTNNYLVMEYIKKAAEVLEIPENESLEIFSDVFTRTLGGFINMGIGIGGELQNKLTRKQRRKNTYNKIKINKETSKSGTRDDTYSYTPFANLKLNESEESK